MSKIQTIKQAKSENDLIEMIDAQIPSVAPAPGMTFQIISDADDDYRIRTTSLSDDGRSFDYTVVPDPNSEYVTTYDKLANKDQFISMLLNPDTNGDLTTRLVKNGMYCPSDENPSFVPIEMKYVGPDSQFNPVVNSMEAYTGTDKEYLATYKINTPEAVKYPVRNLISRSKLDQYQKFDPLLTYGYMDDVKSKNAFLDSYRTEGGYISGVVINNVEYLVFSCSPFYISHDVNDYDQFDLPGNWRAAAIKIEDVLKFDYQTDNWVYKDGWITRAQLKDIPNIYLIPTGPYYFLSLNDYHAKCPIDKRGHSEDIIKIPNRTKKGEYEYILRTLQHPMQTDARYHSKNKEYIPSSFDFGDNYSYYEDNSTGRVKHRAFKLRFGDGVSCINNIITKTTDPVYGFFHTQEEYAYYDGHVWKIKDVSTWFDNQLIRSIAESTMVWRNWDDGSASTTNDNSYPLCVPKKYSKVTSESVDIGQGIVVTKWTYAFDVAEYMRDIVVYGYIEQMPSQNWGTNAMFSDHYFYHDDNTFKPINYMIQMTAWSDTPTNNQDIFMLDVDPYDVTFIDRNGNQPTISGKKRQSFCTVLTNTNTTTTANFKDIGWDNFIFGYQGSFPTNGLLHNVSSHRVKTNDADPNKYEIVNTGLGAVVDQLISPSEMFPDKYNPIIIAIHPLTQLVGDYKLYVSVGRKYHPHFSLAMQPVGISNDHYSTLVSGKEPILVTSDVIEEMLNFNTKRDYTIDFLYSLFLSTDDVLISRLTAEVENFDPLQYESKVDQIIQDDINSNPDNQPELYAATKAALLREASPTTPQFGKMFSYLYDKYGAKIKVDKPKFHSFRTIVAANTVDEGLIGTAGHLRILSTNSSESSVYDELIANGFSESEIKLYSRLGLSMISSIYGSDVSNVLDSVDANNEMTLIHNLVSNQLSNTADLLKRVLDIFKGGGFDPSDSEQQTIISSFSNITNQVANDLLTTVGEFDKLDIAQDIPIGTYNHSLLTRNISFATGYAKSLADALRSDPYLALKQHSDYIKRRTDKTSLKLTVIQGMLDAMDFVNKIPEYLLAGINSLASITKTIASIGLSTISATLKIVDNIDKLIFINETFLSKGIVEYSTIPTLFDDVFAVPNIIGADADYRHIKKKAEVTISKALPVSTFIMDQLLITKDKPVVVNGVEFKYNDYNIMNLFTKMNGYYFPKDGNTQFPILVPNNDDTLSIMPNLFAHAPKYPEKGNVMKLFLNQLDVYSDDQYKINSLTPFVPTSRRIDGVFTGAIAAITVVAGASAAVAAGGLFDPVSAGIAALAASTAASTINGLALDEIISRRTYVHQDKSVYTYFANRYDVIANRWNDYLSTSSNLYENYNFIMTSELIPLFSVFF